MRRSFSCGFRLWPEEDALPPAGLDAVTHAALWFEEGPDGLAPLIDAIGDAKLVLIGVAYKPKTERASHYFKARITEQFDALIHIDVTSALTPLEPWSSREADLPETYPTGV
jgi:erythromycin esterase-like protein